MDEPLDWDTKVHEYLATRFREAPHALNYYQNLWADHKNAKLAGDHFASELICGSDEKFCQRVWEMALGRHLRACGHKISTKPEGHPDYFFEIGDQGVWVEAISPSPGPDLPRNWTTHDPHLGTWGGSVPNTEMLLRWTSAFKEKADKCKKYRCKGIVKPTDIFVIAIDGTQLSKIPHMHGISRHPFVVECVFPIGPIAIPINPETGKLGTAFNTVEAAIQNRNNRPVFKECFLNDEFSGISAVLGCYAASGCYSHDGMLSVQVAHNPLATISLATGQLGTGAEEWVAERSSEDDEGIEWSVKRLS